MIKVVVIGYGLVGKAIVESLRTESYKIFPLNSQTLKSIYSDFGELVRTVNHIAPDILINTAAFTDTRAAEDHDNQDLLYKLNVELPHVLASIPQEFKMIHLSSDYVYGDSDSLLLSESSDLNPINRYGISKVDGEKKVLKSGRDGLILRMGGVYQLALKSLIDTAFAKIINTEEQVYLRDDVVFSPTPVRLVQNTIRECVGYLKDRPVEHKSVLLNFSTFGEVSPFGFVKHAIDYLDANGWKGISDKVGRRISKVMNAENDIARPGRAVMCVKQIETLLSIECSAWADALNKELDEKQHIMRAIYGSLDK